MNHKEHDRNEVRGQITDRRSQNYPGHSDFSDPPPDFSPCPVGLVRADVTIEVRNLTKRFGSFTAVDDVTFSVGKGEILGFLGANGAGKTTVIRMLCGLLNPTSGQATVGGFDIRRQPERIKHVIGYMSQRFSLYEDLTVRENLGFFGGVYGLSPERRSERIAWALELAGLKGREKSLTSELAGGWRQRLALGCAILHEPRIVFLDEPTSGVDPISRRSFWELINQLAEQGTTVLVTTHYLDEAEYCNRIMLIHAGRLIAGGGPHELKSRWSQDGVFPSLQDVFIRLVEQQAESTEAGGPAHRSLKFTRDRVTEPDRNPRT